MERGLIQQMKRLVGVMILTVIVLGALSANSPVISQITLQGRMPEDQYFRIEVSTEAENV